MSLPNKEDGDWHLLVAHHVPSAREPLSLWEDCSIPGSLRLSEACAHHAGCWAFGAGVALSLGGLSPKLSPLTHKHLPGWEPDPSDIMSHNWFGCVGIKWTNADQNQSAHKVTIRAPPTSSFIFVMGTWIYSSLHKVCEENWFSSNSWVADRKHCLLVKFMRFKIWCVCSDRSPGSVHSQVSL